MDYLKELSDKEIWEKIEKASLAERVLNDPDWAVVKEASERIIERAIDKFANVVKADNIVGIIELQVIIRKYKYGLFRELEQLKTEAEFIENQILDDEELQNREMTNSQSPA